MQKNYFKQSLVLLGILGSLSAHAEDKSGSREGITRLPSSGGTVQKDESNFEFSSSRGTASYSIPLPELPKRGDMKPSLALLYNQSSGDSGSGLGIGWSLSSSSISFNDDLGTALHQKRWDNEDFSSHLALNGQRLIPHVENKAGQDYEYSLESSETFVKVRYTKHQQQIPYLGKNGEQLQWTFPGGFVVTQANGRKAFYAEDPASAEADPVDRSRVVRWPVTGEINPQGEAIFYTYAKAQERSYLKQVRFAGDQSVYNFELIETRPSLTSYRAAFRQANGLLYGGLTASFRGQVQSQICLAYVGRDTLSDNFVIRSGKNCETKARSDLAALADKNSSRSLNVLDQLRKVYRFGRGESVTADNSLPPLSFDYSNWNESDSQRNIVFSASALNGTAQTTAFELFDFNLDAIVDLIKSDDQQVQVALGTDDLVNSFGTSVPWTVSRDGFHVKPLLGSPAWHFVEMNGDSFVDLVEVGQGEIHAYLRQASGSFAPAHTLEIPWINPSLFANRSLRWLDLNSDGLTDLIGTEIAGSRLIWKLSINQTLRTADGGYDYYFLESNQQLPFNAPLGNLLADESILMSDVNGDQLADLVRIRPDRGGLCLYENRGDIYADTAALLFGTTHVDVLSASNCDKGRFVAIDGLSSNLTTASRRVWFLDANGDGILDLVSFTNSDNSMKVWLGFGSGDYLKNPLTFSTLDGQGRQQLNVQAGRDRTRVADIDGDGQTELVIFQPGVVGLPPVVVIDFNRLAEGQLVKSNLLTSVQNDTGLRYDIRYASSIDELTRDRSLGLSSRALHFPMYVVKQLVTSEADPQQAGAYKEDREVREMLYHQPVYDALAKKLVGFQNVESITYGDEFRGQGSSTQLSSYRQEIFESDYRLAGRLKSLRVHEFEPIAAYLAQSQETNNLELDDFRLPSMKEYAQKQGRALAGKLLFSQNSQWELSQKKEGHDGEFAYFVRETLRESRLHGSNNQSSLVQNRHEDFDAYNIPHTVTEARAAVPALNGIVIPARTEKAVTDFTASRAQLAALDIINRPSAQNAYVLDGGRSQLIDTVHFTYTATGLTASKERIVHVPDSGSIPEFKTTPNSLTSNTYDIHGNQLTQAENQVLLETVRYDPTGTFVIEQSNAVGHKTRMFYGSETISSCNAVPNLNVAEGLLSAYRDPRGVCSYLAYDPFARRTLFQRDNGYQEFYAYRFAEDGKPSRILKTARRHSSSAPIPEGESEFVQSMEAYTPSGARIASVENLEEGQGIRVVSFEKHNRKKNTVRVYTPYRDVAASLEKVFQDGIIPTAGDEAFTHTTYDAMDRPVQKIHPTGRSETSAYEPWGQTQFASYVKDQSGEKVHSQKKLVQFGKQVFAIIDEREAVFRYGYDIYDNLSEIWLPGKSEAHRYVYDSLNRKIQQCIPGVGCSTFHYDQLGQLSKRINFNKQGERSGSLTTFHDVLGRLLETHDNDQLTVRNQYDSYPAEVAALAQGSALGLLTVAESFDLNKLYASRKTMVYDQPGRLVKRQNDVSGVQAQSFVEKFKYTLDNALQEAEDPFGVRSFYRLSPTMRFTHLETELPWQRGTREVIIDRVSYNARGQVNHIAYRQGSYTNLAYDQQTLLLNQIESSYRKADGQHEFLQYAAMHFNGNGSITEIIDSVPAQTAFGQINRSGKFAYNERDELVRFERYGEVQEFAYDLAGNFTHNTELGEQLTGVSTATLLPPSASDLQYGFDKEGRLSSRHYSGPALSSDPLQDLQKQKQIVETRYNTTGQLIYLKTGQQEIFFGYDGEGKRLYKRVKDRNSTKLADSLFPSKTVTVEPSGAQSFVFIGERRVARIEHGRHPLEKGTWYYYLFDHLGSTDFTMNADGTPVEQMIYRAYGSEPDYRASAQGQLWSQHLGAHASLLPKERTHHRFTGQYLDDDSGLYYYGARYYDPTLGRFVSPDPQFMDNPSECLRSPLECNLYGYARNNPLKFIDPTGTDAKIFVDYNSLTVTVQLTIHVYGKGATQAVADTLQKGITQNWNGFTYTDPKHGRTFNVVFDVKVDVKASGPGTDAAKGTDKRDNWIEITDNSSHRSYVNGTDGKSGIWVGNNAWTAAHEAGHLMGLADRYKDQKQKVDGKDKNISVPNKGWEGNIMAQVGGKVEQKNIDAIAGRAVGTGKGKVEIENKKSGMVF